MVTSGPREHKTAKPRIAFNRHLIRKSPNSRRHEKKDSTLSADSQSTYQVILKRYLSDSVKGLHIISRSLPKSLHLYLHLHLPVLASPGSWPVAQQPCSCSRIESRNLWVSRHYYILKWSGDKETHPSQKLILVGLGRLKNLNLRSHSSIGLQIIQFNKIKQWRMRFVEHRRESLPNA